MLAQAPKFLADGRVLATLTTDDSMEFTGKLNLFAGDERVGRVPHIAIVQKQDSADMLVVYCDIDWNIVGVQAWNAPDGKRVQSVEQAQEIVERYYRNSLGKWCK